ncbi:MAG: glycosyltransferase family 4 protein [Nanoarchaeota archaeon]
MKKKILLMYDFFSEHGGIERVMLFQARALKKAGFNVTFAFAYVDEKLKNERLKEFEVIEYSPFFIKNETIQICSSILRNEMVERFKDFNLIICHSFPASYFAVRIKKKFKIPLIIHLHHPPQFIYSMNPAWAKSSFKRMFSYSLGKLFNPFLKAFDRYCLEKADYYFVAGKAVQRVIQETYGIEGNILYPTVDSNFGIVPCNIKDLESYNLTQDFILGSGRIVKQKRFDYLLNSYSKLKSKNLQLVLAGKWDDSEKEELDNLAKTLRISVLFLGPVKLDDLKKLYNLAKVTVLTCPKEWFGLVPVEAMACGCPVVAWRDNFGPQETVLDNKTGILVEPYSIDSMVKGIDLAINKKWNKRFISKSAEKYNEKAQSIIFLKTIRELLSRSP